jgi:hypothetical protein
MRQDKVERGAPLLWLCARRANTLAHQVPMLTFAWAGGCAQCEHGDQIRVDISLSLCPAHVPHSARQDSPAILITLRPPRSLFEDVVDHFSKTGAMSIFLNVAPASSDLYILASLVATINVSLLGMYAASYVCNGCNGSIACVFRVHPPAVPL